MASIKRTRRGDQTLRSGRRNRVSYCHVLCLPGHLAFLSLPAGRDKQGRNDFIAFVDSFLKGHEDQPYQYVGLDVYGARCAVLHAFSAEVDFHQQNPDAKVFGYHDGGQHTFDPAQNEKLVLIGSASFINDVVLAVQAFCDRCQEDPDLRQRAEGRLPQLLATFPALASGQAEPD